MRKFINPLVYGPADHYGLSGGKYSLDLNRRNK